MSPKVLLIIIAVLALARIVLWVAPAAISSAKQRAMMREYLDAFVIAGVVALVLMQYVVRTFYIPSGSMEPTLDINDVLLANEIQYRLSDPKDEQIAVFEPPAELGTTDFIKRVMAAPGDVFRMHDGVAYRNGVAISEPYVEHKADYDLEIRNYAIFVNGVPLDADRAIVPPRSAWQAPNRVPTGYYLMLGDNRTDSDDGHIWGFLKREQFVGHAFVVFWPPKHIRALR